MNHLIFTLIYVESLTMGYTGGNTCACNHGNHLDSLAKNLLATPKLVSGIKDNNL
jgi:hypothetical protein